MRIVPERARALGLAAESRTTPSPFVRSLSDESVFYRTRPRERNYGIRRKQDRVDNRVSAVEPQERYPPGGTRADFVLRVSVLPRRGGVTR